MIQYATQAAIIGAGPAGLATACVLQQAGWRVQLFERDVFASGVAHFPHYMRFFSTSELVELCGYPLTIPDEKPTRQQYLRYLHRFAEHYELEIHTHHAAERLDGEDGRFLLAGRTDSGEPFECVCEKVVLATGAFDHPNMLGVPGEDLPKVSHYYSEINDYVGDRVLIVGGRHSASETALELCRAGVDVTLCHRGEDFGNLKYWIAPDLENRIQEGRIRAFTRTRVRAIRPRHAVLQTDGGDPFEIENDRVIALTGYCPDPAFLTGLGLAVESAKPCPIFDPETLESTRKGVHVAGVMLAGNVSGAIFIENSRMHGQRILSHLHRCRGAARTGW